LLIYYILQEHQSIWNSVSILEMFTIITSRILVLTVVGCSEVLGIL